MTGSSSHSHSTIALDSLNVNDERFRVSWGRSVERLTSSFQNLGKCLVPILLWNEDEPIVVDGFRRVEAAEIASIDQLPVVYLSNGTSEKDACICALELFLAHDVPNPVEISQALENLGRFFSRDEIIEQWMPRLGLNGSAVIYKRYRAIWKLPESAKKALANGVLDPAVAVFLERFSNDDDRELAVRLILSLRPSKSVQKELLENLFDLAMRDETTITRLIEQSPLGIGEISIEDEDGEGVAIRRNEFRRWLHQRRYPVLSKLEEEFKTALGELGVSDASVLKITPPSFFEGSRYSMKFDFSSVEDLEKRVNELKKILKNKDTLRKFWDK